MSPSKKAPTKRNGVNKKEKREEPKTKEGQAEDKVGLFYFQYGYDLLRCCGFRP